MGSKIWTPKWSPPGVMFWGRRAFQKRRQQVSRVSSACFGCACAPFACPSRWLLQPASHFCELGRPLSARLIFGLIFGHLQGPLIDPFCCWTVAGSAVCFGKEDQPTLRLVIGVCVPLHETKKGSVVRSTISCVWLRRVASEEASSN